MNPIKIMIFLWQLGIVDSLTFLQFCINCGAQYTGLTVAEAKWAYSVYQVPLNRRVQPSQAILKSYASPM